MIGFPYLATANLRAEKILGKFKSLVVQTVDQQRLPRISSIHAPLYLSWGEVGFSSRPQAVRFNRVSTSRVNQSQALGYSNGSAPRFRMDAMPIRSMSTSKTAQGVSAEAGHDLISFINASPTRKVTHEVKGPDTFTY